jgi:hypothetical protein
VPGSVASGKTLRWGLDNQAEQNLVLTALQRYALFLVIVSSKIINWRNHL